MNLVSRKNSLRLKDEDKTLINVIQWPNTNESADALATVLESYGCLEEDDDEKDNR